MIIPEPKLLITLEWHLGIPDGEMKHTTVERYTSDTSEIRRIITETLYESELDTDTNIPMVEYFYGNEYNIYSHRTGERMATAKAETVLYFDDRIFKLEEI
jgi:hypothetical protein